MPKILLTILLLTLPLAQAQAARILLPAGTHDCTDWNTAKDPANLPDRNRMLIWLWGALSGMVLESAHDFLKDAAPESIEAHADRICAAKPQASLGDLVIEISQLLGD